MRLSVVLSLLLAVSVSGVAVGSARAAEPTGATLVVDDDRVQCAGAGFTSIQGAVDAAQPGDLIRVCPGLYEESVVVDKPVALKGDPDAVEAVDCLQPTLLEPPLDQHAVVDPAGADFSVALKLQADGIDLQGLVIQGASVGVDASDSFSGYRVHHNLIQQNSLFGADFGSAGSSPSRADHNCLRENRYGLVTELDDDSAWRNTDLDAAERERRRQIPRDLIDARIDHNTAVANSSGALDVAGPGRRERVHIDHNVIDGSRFGILIQNSSDSTIVANELATTGAAIAAGGANSGLQILDNQAAGGLQALGFTRVNFFIDWFAEPSTATTVAGNRFTGHTQQAIVARASRLQHSSLRANITSDSGDGIFLEAGNNENELRGNVANGNARHGIYSQGATGNLFEANQMLGNGLYDARDDNRPANTWTDNHCVTDFPAGTICGVG